MINQMKKGPNLDGSFEVWFIRTKRKNSEEILKNYGIPSSRSIYATKGKERKGQRA